MDASPVRLILASGIFASSDSEERWYGTAVANLSADAQRALALTAGEDYDLLRRSAREDQRRSLANLLSGMLLLEPAENSLRRAIDLWVEAQCEMLSRLNADTQVIHDWLLQTPLSGKVVGIEAALSDRHDGGRTTAILTFDSGAKIVYKPRAMQMEAWYSQLLCWLNQSGAPASFLGPRVLSGNGYGWMEYVPHRRCTSLEELRAYYRNAGGLLCILHLLRATDCHFQNLVACGVHPVLVDAEMLFQPDLPPASANKVTRTGMIPSFRAGPGGQFYDVSALGCVSPRTTHFEIPKWDKNGVHFSPGTLTPEKNVPFAEGEDPQPHKFVEQIVHGFTETYRFAMKQRAVLAERITTAATLQVRYLARETIDYAVSVGAASSLSALQPPYTIFSPLLPLEEAAVRQFDVPRFTRTADSRDLHGIAGCFPCSGYELASAGLCELSDDDLQKQLACLRLSWGFSKLAKSLA